MFFGREETMIGALMNRPVGATLIGAIENRHVRATLIGAIVNRHFGFRLMHNYYAALIL